MSRYKLFDVDVLHSRQEQRGAKKWEIDNCGEQERSLLVFKAKKLRKSCVNAKIR